MRLLILRDGTSAEISIDGSENGINNGAQLGAFLAQLLHESRTPKFFLNGKEAQDHNASLCAEEIVCYYPERRRSRSKGIVIEQMRDLYYNCKLGKVAKKEMTQDFKPLEIVKACSVPKMNLSLPPKVVSQTAIPRPAPSHPFPRSSEQQTVRRPPAHLQAPKFKKVKPGPSRAAELTAEEKILLLTSSSEEGEVAAPPTLPKAQSVLPPAHSALPTAPSTLPETATNDRVDILALEALPLDAIKRKLQDKAISYRAIVEEESCPVISAERTALVTNVIDAQTLEVREGSSAPHPLSLNTVYSLRVAAGPHSDGGCGATGCNSAVHALFKQVNFYFSAKNLARDEFMQAHLAQSNGEGMNAQLLLNFPRVRKMNLPLHVILNTLAAHQARPGVHYRLERNLIAPLSALNAHS